MPARRKKLNRGSGPEELVQDPCCHTYVPKRSAIKKKIAGRWFYFCNQECMENYINGIKNRIKKRSKKGVDKAKWIRYVIKHFEAVPVKLEREWLYE